MKIGVFDSGIGGLSVLYELSKRFNGTDFIYFGDNLNAPYGNRNIFKLKYFGERAVNLLLEEGVDCIVTACNTISLSVGKYLREYSSVPVYGVFPPVEMEIIKGHKTLLLSTEVTSKYYKKYDQYIDVVPVNGLVEEIERNPKNAINIKIQDFLPSLKINYDSVILGCTHYFFAKIGISDHFQKAHIIDGSISCSDYVYKMEYLKNRKDFSKENKYIFIGEEKDKNSEIFNDVVLYPKNAKKNIKKRKKN